MDSSKAKGLNLLAIGTLANIGVSTVHFELMAVFYCNRLGRPVTDRDGTSIFPRPGARIWCS